MAKKEKKKSLSEYGEDLKWAPKIDFDPFTWEFSPHTTAADKHFGGVPYEYPSVNAYDEMRLSNMEDITEQVQNGYGRWYRDWDDNQAKGGKKKWSQHSFYEGPDGRIWMQRDIPLNGTPPPGYKELKYSDIRKMLPSGRKYFGAETPRDARYRALDSIPGLGQLIYEKARLHGVDPDGLAERFSREGYLDQKIDEYNYGIPLSEQEGYWQRAWDEQGLSGFNSFGLDWTGRLLHNGAFSLKDPKATWRTGYAVNEKGESVTPADPDNLYSAIELMAAQMAYNQGKVKKLYHPDDSSLGRYTNASYNLGLYNDRMRDSAYVNSHYGYPVFFTEDRKGRWDTPAPKPQAPIRLFPEQGVGFAQPGPWAGEYVFPVPVEPNYVGEDHYDYLLPYSNGGSIHIAPSKKGTFTAAAKKHGKSVPAFASQVLAHKENYSPAMVKKANFARNAAKWHSDGGFIDRMVSVYGSTSAALEAIRKLRGL